MGRKSRTYRLTLSAAGMDVLIDAHCHLIRTTRCLLAWGTTLHIAVAHLDTVAPDAVMAKLTELPAAGLGGGEVHFLGAPTRLNDIAARIARRVTAEKPDLAPPELRHIYIVALQEVSGTKTDLLRAAYASINASELPCA
ncbi:MAG: hypothetical protein JWR80_5972 [Bradyrhizobium sp.]|nr:hypothetical protein [Bradyrhizobium sp.]